MSQLLTGEVHNDPPSSSGGGKPAARITDAHGCPEHAPNPIDGSCSTNVYAGGIQSARVTDMSTCTAPIVKGSTGVFINGLPAARMGDPTAHGGLIAEGDPTVLIGETATGDVSGNPFALEASFIDMLNNPLLSGTADNNPVNLQAAAATAAAFVSRSTAPFNLNAEQAVPAQSQPQSQPHGVLYNLNAALGQALGPSGQNQLLQASARSDQMRAAIDQKLQDASTFSNYMRAAAEQMLQKAGAIAKASSDSLDVTKHNDVGRRIMIDAYIGLGIGEAVKQATPYLKGFLSQGKNVVALTDEAAQTATPLVKGVVNEEQNAAKLSGEVAQERPRQSLVPEDHQFVPYNKATAARDALGYPGQGPGALEAAHIIPDAIGKQLPGWNKGTALAKLLPANIHTAMDDAWKGVFQALRDTGRTQASANEVFGILKASINHEIGLTPLAKEKMIETLEKEMFGRYGVSRDTMLNIPSTTVKNPGLWTF